MPFCNKCRIYLQGIHPHTCPPVWEVRQSDNSDNAWEKVYAFDEEDAAEKWAEEDDCNSAEYSIVGGQEAEVWVREPGSDDIKKFRVTGEALPTYYANEL